MKTVLYCTQKTLKNLGIKRVEEKAPRRDEPFYLSWYCNLIRVGRKNCLLFTNSKTLFSVSVVPGRTKSLPVLEKTFKNSFARAMRFWKVPDEQVKGIIEKMDGMELAKSSDKRILGSMVEFGHIMRCMEDERGFGGYDEKLFEQLNRPWMKAIGNKSPAECFLTQLGLRHEWEAHLEKQRREARARFGDHQNESERTEYSEMVRDVLEEANLEASLEHNRRISWGVEVDGRICQFRIGLRETNPEIWRRIQVPADFNFWALHTVIQDSMGWKDCHLHAFAKESPRAEFPGKVEYIGIPGDDDASMGVKCHASWKVPITRHFKKPGDTLLYRYDFGDDWEHDLMLEEISEGLPGEKYPQCTDGARACPPEDSGGVGGYERVLEIMRDPSHEEYEDTMTWLGGKYDPECFEAGKVRFDDPAKRWDLAFR